jgi:hypothetical protein
MCGSPRKARSFPYESARTELMRTNTNSCGILTFAIPLDLSLVLDPWKHLGENDQKQAIPAGNIKVAANQGPP